MGQQKHDVNWLMELSIGALACFSRSCYANREGYERVADDKANIINKYTPVCYLGWNDNFVKYDIYCLKVLHGNAIWEILAVEDSLKINKPDFDTDVVSILYFTEIKLIQDC